MTIHIRELSMDAIIGILEDERISPQRVVIDIDMEYAYKEGEFINYAIVAKSVEEMIVANQYLLLEEALLDIEKSLSMQYKKLLKKLYIEIKKPDILTNCVVSLSKVKNF